jgi:hypothetical protein
VDGLLLRYWSSGPHAGEPKYPPAVRSLLERGMVEVRIKQSGPRAFSIKARLATLRQLQQNRQAMDAGCFALLRRKFGRNATEDAAAA